MGSRCTAAGFAALPATLTRLVILAPRNLFCGPSTTPGLTQLTALQWLEVSAIAEFDAAALVNSKQLQHLSLEHLKLSSVSEAGQGPQLSVLQHMTRLQHLQLPSHEESPNSLAGATEQDFAALTASSQLTYLDIGIIGELQVEKDYTHTFPLEPQSEDAEDDPLQAGRQLPQLRVLVGSMCLLESTKALRGLVACAPHLERIDLSTVSEVGGAFDNLLEPAYNEGPLLHTAALLGNLTGLTSLKLDMSNRMPDDRFWRSLACLTTLKFLQMTNVHYDCLGGVVQLRECQQLTRLHVDHEDFGPKLSLETPEGKAPDVWQRLPAQGLTLALRHHHEDTFHEPGTMNSLAEAVSEHSLHVEATCMQLRQELTELRAHSQQWGNERRELPQEVAELRAAVATMQAQVQSLLEQKQF